MKPSLAVLQREKRCLLSFLCLLAPTVFLFIAELPAAAEDQQGGRGRNARIFVPPTPQKITVDGKLEDWDLSGQIYIYITDETRETMHARVAMMHDQEALYVSGAVRDLSPMMNRHDPHSNADRAWDADAFQLRLMMNPSMDYPVDMEPGDQKPEDHSLAHLLFWYYTDRQEPCLQLVTSMNLRARDYPPHGIVPKDKFQAAYRVTEDKKGYTFEYRIPWTTLKAAQPPKAGDAIGATIQMQWSTPDGLTSDQGGWAFDLMGTSGFGFQTTSCWGRAIFTEHGNLPPTLSLAPGAPDAQAVEKPLPLTFSYDLPKDGEVSVALVNSEGQTVRHLVAQAARKAGRITERWDGLDENGKPLPAGKYTWKGIYHDPITTRHLLSVHNSGRPPFATDDGTGGWGADHGHPATTCAVGEYMLLAWDGGEAGWSLMRTDLKGRRQWGIRPGAVHLASDGTRIFASGGNGFHDGSGVEVFSLADGRPLNFGRGTVKVEQPSPIPASEMKTPARLYGTEGQVVSSTLERELNNVTGLAYYRGVLYVSYANRDLVALYDAQQGTITATWKIPSPRRLAVCPDGSLVIISGEGVAFVNDGKVSRQISSHLDTPISIAVDRQDLIYVANRGALQNVSVFSAKGEYLRSIGLACGRPRRGDYDKRGMLEPGGMSIDAQDQLWVAETLDCPKRMSVWSTKTGECLQEFFGAGHYATSVSMDPKHEDEVLCHNVVWQVDLAKGTWYPKSTMWRANDPNEVGSHPFSQRVITATNGKQYAWVGSFVFCPLNVLYERKGNTFYPLFACFEVGENGKVPFPVLQGAGLAKGAYVWQDLDNNQKVSPNEVSGPTTFRTIAWVDTHLGIWSESNGGQLLKPTSFNA
ncbi:MAG TPA: FlgD immunoglobulin-like domain containing protein, partial [Clostridia bacterium]|nr:FlgD immunoglobulin-like domain containing protein [Clostridia bacterium]